MIHHFQQAPDSRPTTRVGATTLNGKKTNYFHGKIELNPEYRVIVPELVDQTELEPPQQN
jgi:hypothetical protein